MPLTPFQSRVFQILAGNRSPDSLVAGASVIHRHPDSPRFSEDVDLFHESESAVEAAFHVDVGTLRDRGFEVSPTLSTPTHRRAILSEPPSGNTLKLEWAMDSAWRFFPAVEDTQLGWRLHDADAATNKVLALAGRQAPRDYTDALFLDLAFAPFEALVWAAPAKDPGLTPELILDSARRFHHWQPSELEVIHFHQPIDPVTLKMSWNAMLERADQFVSTMPPQWVGRLFLDRYGRVCRPDPVAADFARFQIHEASLRGAWPRVVD